MKNRFTILTLLAFIPPVICPIGLFMAGDKNVLTIQNSTGSHESFRVPDDVKGARFIINEKTDKPIYVYVNSQKEQFEKKMNPPASEELEIEKDLVSLSDKRLLGLFHYVITTNMSNRRLRISDTAKILKYVDEAMLLRNGQSTKTTMNAVKWKLIKEEINDAIMSKELNLEQAKTSITPVQVKEQNADSDNE